MELTMKKTLIPIFDLMCEWGSKNRQK